MPTHVRRIDDSHFEITFEQKPRPAERPATPLAIKEAGPHCKIEITDHGETKLALPDWHGACHIISMIGTTPEGEVAVRQDRVLRPFVKLKF